MAFFKRELSPVERFESALREKQAARQKLADRLSLAEGLLGEKRAAAERLAVAGAANAKLDRAEADMRTVEERAKTLRTAFDPATLRDKCGRAMVAMLLGCGLRRSELLSATRISERKL